MGPDVERYLEMIAQPWGQMFYRLVWAQLPEFDGDVLDYGSGLGVTACYLARDHKVVAVEPDRMMVTHRKRECEYEQLLGGVERLRGMEGRFGLIVCHNVLEYVPDRRELLRSLAACLRPGGAMSVVRHNRLGKVFHAAVFRGEPAEALDIYNGGDAYAETMQGVPDEYGDDELLAAARGAGLSHRASMAVRSFYGLGDNAAKHSLAWQDGMFALERAVETDPAFLAVAMYRHLLFGR